MRPRISNISARKLIGLQVRVTREHWFAARAARAGHRPSVTATDGLRNTADVWRNLPVGHHTPQNNWVEPSEVRREHRGQGLLIRSSAQRVDDRSLHALLRLRKSQTSADEHACGNAGAIRQRRACPQEAQFERHASGFGPFAQIAGDIATSSTSQRVFIQELHFRGANRRDVVP